MGTDKIVDVNKLYSLEAEAGVLGSMLLDPKIIPQVLLKLPNSEAFYLPEHKVIFNALLKLHIDNKPIDAIILRSELKEQGKLDEIGGVEYIAKILDSVPSSATAGYYAGIVKEKVKRRKLVDVGEKITEAIESTGPVGESVWQIQQIAAGLDGALEPCGDSQPIIKRLVDVQPQPIDYLWFNKFPRGMLTQIVGDPGLGKSYLSLDMTARVSTGRTWPDGDGMPDNHAPKGSVVILSAEDDLAHVIRPRLDSLGADVGKIIALEGVRLKDDNGQYEGFFNLQRDIPALQKAVRSCKDCKLVIIDPLSAYLGVKIDSHRDADVRSVLAPLVELAEQSGVAVVGIMHLNKSQSSKAVYRAMGSIAFTAAARTVWLVSKDPGSPDSKRRLLTPAKHNILIDPTGLAFEIIDGRVVFESEPVTLTSDEALGQGGTVEAPALNQAKQWLTEQLIPGKAIVSTELAIRAQENGISESTLRRAKRELKVVSYPLQVSDKRVWFVEIPKDAQDTLNKDDEQQYTTIHNNTQVGLLA